MQKIIVCMAFGLALFLVGSCSKDSTDYTKDADCTGLNAANNSYTISIKTILDVSCGSAGCHDTATHEKNVILDTYAGSKKAFESQDALCGLHHGSGCVPMPDGLPKLSDAVINLIDCWVKNGYVE